MNILIDTNTSANCSISILFLAVADQIYHATIQTNFISPTQKNLAYIVCRKEFGIKAWKAKEIINQGFMQRALIALAFLGALH